jgi:hypothetical protein
MDMKKLMMLSVLLMAAWGCRENVVESDLTGNETTYALLPGSDYPVGGTVTLREKKNGATQVVVNLTGTERGALHPVHLHLGNLSTPDADIAALLTPLEGATGQSETLLTQLADESTLQYKDIAALNACVKVHLADTGPGRDVILAGANIGLAAQQPFIGGRKGMAVCGWE